MGFDNNLNSVRPGASSGQIHKEEDKLNIYNPEVYEGMKVLRDDFDCIDGNYFLLPTMKEMFGDDLLEERFLDMADAGITNAKDAAFYAKGPFSTDLGYHPEKGGSGKGCFVLKLSALALQDYMFNLNRIDGDTCEFNVNYIDDGGKGFKIGDKSYSGFKDFLKKNNLGSSLTIRSAFINTPEIPHFEIQAIPKGSKNIKKMTLGELKKLSAKANVTYLKYETDKETTVKDRSDDEKIKVYRKEVNGKDYYYEIRDDIKAPGAIQNKNSNYEYRTIVTVDESEKNTLLGGYKAQSIVKNNLKGGTKNQDIYLVVDASMITENHKSGDDYSFNNWWYAGDAVKGLIKDWKTSLNDVSFSNLDYSPYGTDKYGRSLGTVYLKSHADDKWTNLSKLILSSDTMSNNNPDYSGSPELESIGGNISEYLQGWSYDINNYKFVDLYADMQEAYDKKLAIHKEITGLDFDKRRDCTVMIGDTLLTIPPTSIKNSSVLTYEKKNILRGKGSMNKEQNREQILEIELYFYNEAGINGIPYETTLPNGEAVTYYMNGLRSLIAQFKVAPFLPIENGFINDILCIEAVSLESVQTINVEGFPGLVKTILTLRDFNYRMYMSDLPIDDEDMYSYAPPGKNDGDEKKEEEKKETNKNATKKEDVSDDIDISSIFANMFAKTIDWELFRFYYQRAIMKGEVASRLEYGSEDYLDIIYDNKNVLQRSNICSSSVGFYVPDPDWLEKALEVKKDRDAQKESLADVQLDDASLKFMEGFKTAYNSLNALNSLTTSDAEMDQSKLPHYVKKYYSGIEDLLKSKAYVDVPGNIKDVLGSNNTNFICQGHNDKGLVLKYISPIFSPLMTELEKSSCIASTTLDESITGGRSNGYKITYTINCRIDESRLSRDQVNNIYEAIRNNGKADESCFKNGVLKIKFTMNADNLGYILQGSESSKYGSTNTMVLEADGGFAVLKGIANQYSGNSFEGQDFDQSTSDTQNSEMKEAYQDYRNPKAMQFIEYVEDVIATNFSITMQNTFTRMYLKSVDGYAPQYTGAEDTVIELQFITNDSVVTSLLNNLPGISVQTVKKYRRILSSWPLRVRNSMLQLMGINEVLIERAEVSTVEDVPGLYEINLRLISVDRTVREREALKKVGQGQTTTNDEYQIRQYFEMDKVLSKVDLYPDLDIPSLEELSDAGFEFSKYYLNNENDRSYPDPDFYMIYAHMYTSALIKKIMKDSLIENLYGDNEKSKSNTMLAVEDILGVKVYTGIDRKKDPATKTTKAKQTIEDANENAKYVSAITDSCFKEIKKNNEEQAKAGKNTDRDHEHKMRNVLLYILACDVQKGWTIKNGWIATKCEKATNDALRERFTGSANIGTVAGEANKNNKDEVKKEEKERAQVNAYTTEIDKKRKRAIELIDSLLSSKIKKAPIGVSVDKKGNPSGLGFEKEGFETGGAAALKNSVFAPYIEAVNNVFKSSEGQELLGLLCPLGCVTKKLKGVDLGKKGRFTAKHQDVFLRYIAGFLYASACAISGAEAYAQGKTINKWWPRTYTKNKKGTKIPFAKVKNSVKNDAYARSYESAFVDGVCLGPFLLKKYKKDELLEVLKYNPVYDLFKDRDEDLEHGAMYKKNDNGAIYRDGFMDRYYNHKTWNSAEVREYRANVLFSERYSAEAFLRIVLMHLRKLILEGVIISEIDVIASDFSSIREELSVSLDEMLAVANATTKFSGKNFNKVANSITGHGTGENKKPEEQVKDIFDQIIRELPESFTKSFCARMIYPFMSAVTDADPAITEMILSEDNATLDAITSNPLVGQCKNSVFDKFMAALYGINMFDSLEKNADSSTSVAQRLMSGIGRSIYIAASNDPRHYVMDSNYDMLVNDKRGRLVRAFPTYYMLFIDEGREIGLWRLFDNFYSMSAIADMTITKSRKNPTDVCTFSMNNMFDSYSDTYSDATTQKYMDTYGIKDVFSSVFTPNVYAEKEDMLRKRQILPDTTVMKPGVRMHVRIGYGSDASKLPIVFNGKIAEVVNGDVMDIVAQGDGHELTNPLNAFGELEAQSLIEAQQDINIAKDLRGALARGGLHPKELMAEILTAKHGGMWKAGARRYSGGQFFNDNPFGIYHFGDHRYKGIFELGEPVQNLFDVMEDPCIEDKSMFIDEENPFSNRFNSYELRSPTINTTLQDKTAWQILEMCANSGLDYIGAIRDFGLRSTVFLGRPNDYYAYAYKKVDDVIMEKRKPFQQFHYYNSYTDIIYNCISASEAAMRTNAVGTWQSSDWLWGKEQATVGPIYLDMNIYPEYQKSMTVDTGLVAAGNGGIDIPFIQRFLETTSLSSTKGNRVNKPLAEMITTNCLKNSVKDMYTGELCVIGDPTVKPYDRIGLDDTYEDMSGTFEVESVIHSINAETGFTTTIIPDVIVRQSGSRETERMPYEKNLLYAFKTGLTTRFILSKALNHIDSKVIRAIAKSSVLYGTNETVMNTFGRLAKVANIEKYIKPGDDGKVLCPNLKKIFDRFENFSPGMAASMSAIRHSDKIDLLLDLVGKDKLEPSDIAELFAIAKDLDLDEYQKSLEKLLNDSKYEKGKEAIEELLDTFKNNKKELEKLNIKDIIGKDFDLDKFKLELGNALDIVDKEKKDKTLKDIRKALEALNEIGSKPDNMTDALYDDIYKQLSIIFGDTKLGDLVDADKCPSFSTYIDDIGKNILKFVDGEDGIKLKNVLSKLMDKKVSSKLLADSSIFMALNPATLAFEALKMLISFVISSNVKAMFNSWLKSIQALCVFPLQKNMRPLIAGMNGHKGSMMAYPPEEPYNSIQGMVIQGLEKATSNLFGSLILGEFIDLDSMDGILETYKSNLGIPGGEEAENIKNERLIQAVQEDLANECRLRSFHYNAVVSKYRVQSFDTGGGKTPEYKKHMIKVFRDSQDVEMKDIGVNEKVLALYPIEDDPEIKKAINGTHDNIKKLTLVHSKSDKEIQINFESGARMIKYTQGPGSRVYDMPLLQEDALFALKRIINDKALQEKEVVLKSGVRVNSSKTWQNTGFRFLISSNSPEALLKAVKTQKSKTKFTNQLLFNYQETSGGISICVYPPKENKEKEDDK